MDKKTLNVIQRLHGKYSGMRTIASAEDILYLCHIVEIQDAEIEKLKSKIANIVPEIKKRMKVGEK